DAAPPILAMLCETLGWDVGAVWLLDRPVALLRCVEVWHLPGVAVPNFEQACRERTFSMGIGVPGRIWSSGRVLWIPDVGRDSNFPRARVAIGEGLRGAVGFPIFSGADFVGIMEFFSREVREPDEE